MMFVGQEGDERTCSNMSVLVVSENVVAIVVIDVADELDESVERERVE